MRRALFIILAFVLLAGCSRQPDARLVRVNELINEHANRALATLDSINRDSLSKADRHYYNFLTVKARDKAYIAHTSDSLIVDAINYYIGKDLYPEVLYYGGRVYSDLGDYPTALDYFQRALDEAGETTAENMAVKGNILSQMARLLNSLRLYTQAIPYMKEVLTLDSLERDTFNLAYDHQLLGAIYMHQDSLTHADACFKKATSWAKYLMEEDQADMQMYRAAVKLRQNEVDSALFLIANVPMKIHNIGKNLSYANASSIYLAAGIQDSSFHYADMLIHSTDDNNRKQGYYTLFSSNLYNLLPQDSIPVYINRYVETVENHYNNHESQSGIMQNAFYNYQIQQRQRENAEQRNLIYSYLVWGLIIALLIVIFMVIVLKYRKKALLLSLQTTSLRLHELINIKEGNEDICSFELNATSDVRRLKKRLNEQVNILKKQSEEKKTTEYSILQSDVYQKIEKCVTLKKAIPDDSPIWEELEQAVLTNAPHFKKHLQGLASKQLKPIDYHIVLLIRCGISSSQMVELLCRTKSTISYHRKLIGDLLLVEHDSSNQIENLILSI